MARTADILVLSSIVLSYFFGSCHIFAREFSVLSQFLEAYTAVDGVHRTMTKGFRKSIVGQQWTVDEFRILDVLANDLATTAVECSRQLNIPPGAVSKLIDRLVKRQFVQRGRDKQDRRVILLQITDEGLEEYDVALKALNTRWDEMLYDVGANIRKLAKMASLEAGRVS